MKTLFTIGYGNDAADKFLERLKSADINLVVDVRRSGSKSWNRKYDQDAIKHFLYKEGQIITYPAEEFGDEGEFLPDYPEWMAINRQEDLEQLHACIAAYPQLLICLLCAERDAYKDGKVNCHRVYVADALVELLGTEWVVKHL